MFDIDGTLIWTGGVGSRAMTRAFGEWSGIENGLEGIAVPGRTDTIILRDILARHGLAPDRAGLEALQEAYFRCLAEELARPDIGPGVLPGVVELLSELESRPSTTLGLLTGNHSRTARMKLERFGLSGYFRIGAFGEDAADRNDLVRFAVERAKDAGVPPVESRDVVVVGDTPLDVACARANGAAAVAVATGGWSAEELEVSGADLVLPDFSDTHTFLDYLDRN